MLGGASENDIHQSADPSVLDQYLGVAGNPRRTSGHSGAGHSDDEIDEELEDDQLNPDFIDPNLAPLQEVMHQAVPVPAEANPLHHFEDPKGTFLAMLAELQRHDLQAIPLGYHIHEQELPDGYPEAEVISVGFRKTRALEVELPSEVWKPRAVCWILALLLLKSVHGTM
jgi:hypothetical protein